MRCGQYEALQREVNVCIAYIKAVLSQSGGDVPGGVEARLRRLGELCDDFLEFGKKPRPKNGQHTAYTLDLAKLAQGVGELLNKQETARRELVMKALDGYKLRDWTQFRRLDSVGIGSWTFPK